jgi:hypothetical protein
MRSLRHTSWLFALALAASSLLLFASTRGFAADPPGYFPLIVRGGNGVTATYAGNVLTVQFRKSSVGAGNPRTYLRMPVGSAAWVDRALNKAEPFVVKQRINQKGAATIIGVLQNKVRFWNFICRNTNAGYLEARRSEPVFAQVRID